MPATITLDQLAPTFTGQLLQPTDAGYDDARRVHNGLIDKKPAIVARCRGTADVVDAVTLARSMNLEIAVRGGGHNVGGRGTIDGGLMIDLAPMKGIHVDPAKRTNLRRHHRRNCREPRIRCAVPNFCQTEIEHLHRTVGAQLDVRGLQVAMDDTVLVRGLERLGDLPRGNQRLVDGNRPARNAIGQRRAVNELHDERGRAVGPLEPWMCAMFG
jgi:hypothetical protein